MGLDEHAYACVLNFIRESSYGTGDRLPPERILADRLNLSRHRLRLALARMEAEGSVHRYIGKGTFIADGEHGSDTAPPQTANFTSPREVMEARLALEPSLARLAAFHATARDFQRLETCLERGNAPNDVAAFRRWDLKLHQAITHATSNTLLEGVFRYIHSDRNRYLWGRLGDSALEQDKSRLAEYIKQHSAIVEAIRARDPDVAEATMRAHLDTVRQHLFGGF